MEGPTPADGGGTPGIDAFVQSTGTCREGGPVSLPLAPPRLATTLGCRGPGCTALGDQVLAAKGGAGFDAAISSSMGGTGCLARAWHAAGVVRSPARGGPVSRDAVSYPPARLRGYIAQGFSMPAPSHTAWLWRTIPARFTRSQRLMSSPFACPPRYSASCFFPARWGAPDRRLVSRR